MSGLSTGVYMVTITDANDCTTNGFDLIPTPDSLMITGTVYPYSGSTCNGAAHFNVEIPIQPPEIVVKYAPA